MRKLILAVVTSMLALPVLAAHYDKQQIDDIYENEATGLRYYKRQDFPKAFKILSETAALGMKNSQYILGFMFIKGEGVDKNVLFGLAWMGLATELGNDEWLEKYDGLYSSLSDAHKSLVDAKIDEYREKFGASVQGITCSNTSEVGSRAIRWKCRKGEGSYTLHEIEIPIEAE
jgi:TPR repeat protein